MNEEKKYTNGFLFSIIAIILLIISMTLTSYAFFSYTKTGDVENRISSGSISFTYNETSNGISIVNAHPMTDSVGKSIVLQSVEDGINQGYFDFNVTGAIRGDIDISYEVYAVMKSNSTLNPDYVKIYLTDGALTDAPVDGYDGSVVPTYSGLPTATSNASGKRLYLGTFSNTDTTHNFRLRMWVADTYTGTTNTDISQDGIIESGTVSETFTITINVKSL